jgi:hypothetical protein
MMAHPSDNRDPAPPSRGWWRYIPLAGFLLSAARFIIDLLRH